MRAKYQKAIDYLMQFKDDSAEFYQQVRFAWKNPHTTPVGCLFQFLTPTGHVIDFDGCGCPTMIKMGMATAYHLSLTEAVLAADIPPGLSMIEPRHLAMFAELQMKADDLWHRNTDDDENNEPSGETSGPSGRNDNRNQEHDRLSHVLS